MGSNRRPRGPRQPYTPDDDDVVETRAPRRDPRRRTPYTPRERDARPPKDDYGVDDYLDEPPRRQRVAPPRRTPGQPARGSAQQRQLHTERYEYEVDAYVDEGGYDDRVIDTQRTSTRQSADPGRRAATTRQQEPYAAGQLDYDEYAEGDYDDSFDDGFIDEDDWYEEEAAAGGYRPRQRSTRSMPRPSISMPRPSMPQVTLPRPTVPGAVRNAALIQDRNSLALSGVLLLSLIGMVILTMMRIDGLAPGFATHISASGIEEDVRSEDALWQLPLMAGSLLLMNLVLAWFLAAWSTFSARFLLVTSIIVHVVIWVALLRFAL